MALQTFTWNNGTSENPVELNQSQLSLLLKLALDANVQSDVRGHITTSSGKIQKYTKWQLEQKYENLVIHAEEEADTFSIRPLRSAINEGESTEIIVTGMSSGSVKFRLVHSFRGVSGISQSAAEARVHIEGNTLVVDNPQENAAWVDALTIQAIPVYEDWSDDVTPQTCTVTITAKEIMGITLNAPSSVVYGEEFVSEVLLVPNSNTKKNYVSLDATCISDGTLPVRKPSTQGLNVYMTAPAEECELSLTVNAYLFGDTETASFSVTKSGIESKIPSVKFIVTTDGTFSDISAANPKITLQKVDSQDTPIGEPVVLTGTVSGSSLVYTYLNVKGDGTERYRVGAEAVYGYIRPVIPDILPDSVVTEINVEYEVVVPDVYLVCTDGTEYDYDSLFAMDFILPQGKAQSHIKLVSADGTILMHGIITDDDYYDVNPYLASKSKGSYASAVMGNVSYNKDLLNGYVNTERIIAGLSNENVQLQDDTNIGAVYAHSVSVQYNGGTLRGYLPSYKELALLISNRNKVNQMCSTIFNNSSIMTSANNFLTCTKRTFDTYTCFLLNGSTAGERSDQTGKMIVCLSNE